MMGWRMAHVAWGGLGRHVAAISQHDMEQGMQSNESDEEADGGCLRCILFLSFEQQLRVLDASGN